MIFFKKTAKHSKNMFSYIYIFKKYKKFFLVVKYKKMLFCCFFDKKPFIHKA